MQALDTIVSISGHRLVVEDSVLPDHVERARVIVLWEVTPTSGRRTPPPALAGAGEERGSLIDGSPLDDWDAVK